VGISDFAQVHFFLSSFSSDPIVVHVKLPMKIYVKCGTKH
jgi:hypothetical protein